MRKEDIEPPEPGSLPPRISFIKQRDGSAGYYVRFKDLSEGHVEEDGGPIRKYVPLLPFDSQEEALQAAINFRDRTAKELGFPIEPTRDPHDEETREKMSESHNRVGLRGLGLTLSNSNGTIYPILRALWSGEEGQKAVTKAMTQRGIYASVEALAPCLQEHIHSSRTEEEITRRGAEGTAQRLSQIKEDAGPESQERKRIESLFESWAKKNPKDRELLEKLLSPCSGEKR